VSPDLKALREKLLAWALVVALAAVAAFAFWPQPVPAPLPEEAQHFAAFATLAGLWRAADRRPSATQIAIALLALAGAIEALQWAFTSRHAEWRDLAADAAGVAAALGVAAAISRRWGRRLRGAY